MSDDAKIQRNILPIPDQPQVGLMTYDAKDPDTKFPPIRELRPPAGAPNVLVVLLDDVGFGAVERVRRPVPTRRRRAARGQRSAFNRFHTTALCSPTRQALLTGRNHHSVGMGAITEIATLAPGYSSVRPTPCAPLAEILKLNGYSTAQFGKCHEVPVWQTSPMGPFDAWPTGGGGFEYFYGFIGGETNQYYPALYEGTTPVEPDKTPEEGYHFTEDMTDQGDRVGPPAEGADAGQAVLHVLRAGRDPCAAPRAARSGPTSTRASSTTAGTSCGRRPSPGRRSSASSRADCELTARPPEIPAWDDMPAELKPVLARQMEVYAGFLEHTDHHVGRLIDALEELGVARQHAVYYIIGDNGASAEGTLQRQLQRDGSTSTACRAPGDAGVPDWQRIDEFGGPEAYNHYAVGWAHAMDTPYQWTKQVASHWGGTRNGTIVHWPKGIKAKGECARSSTT